MAASHFDAHLPKGVELGWTVGTASGNPSSDAAYGFVLTDGMLGEQYAIAILRVEAERDVVKSKTAVCIGPLAVGDYRRSEEAGELVLDLSDPDATDAGRVWSGRAEVQKRQTSEEVIGGLLRLLFRIPQ